MSMFISDSPLTSQWPYHSDYVCCSLAARASGCSQSAGWGADGRSFFVLHCCHVFLPSSALPSLSVWVHAAEARVPRPATAPGPHCASTLHTAAAVLKLRTDLAGTAALPCM